MKKTLYFILMTAVFSFCDIAVHAEIGSVAGNYYSTDIVTYVNNAPITSYNIGGKTVIEAEALNWDFGFDVYWIPDERELRIFDKGGNFASLQAMAGSLCKNIGGETGVPAGNYYETDITAYIDGQPIESYNIGGVTCILAEGLRDFGYNVDWDADARTLSITKPLNFYKIDTDFGTIETNLNYADNTTFGTWSKGLKLTLGNETVSLKTFCTADTVAYVKLADLCSALGVECSLKQDTVTYENTTAEGAKYDVEEREISFDINKDTIAPADSSFEELTDGEFEQVITDCYYIDSNVYAIVNGDRLDFVTTHIARNGMNAFRTGIYVINSEVYVPAYFTSRLLNLEYLKPQN